MSDKDHIIKIRNAVFEAADGASLDVAMQGLIMAQGKLIASVANQPEEADHVLNIYYKMLRDALPLYCAEFHAKN